MPRKARSPELPLVPDPATEPTLGVPHAARIIGLSRGATYAAIEAGDIPAIRVGGNIRVLTREFLTKFGLLGEVGRTPVSAATVQQLAVATAGRPGALAAAVAGRPSDAEVEAARQEQVQAYDRLGRPVHKVRVQHIPAEPVPPTVMRVVRDES